MNLNIFKKKLFWRVFGLDLVFVFLFTFLSRFFFSRIYGVIVIMQRIGDLLTGYEGLDRENITLDQASELSALVNQLNSNLGGLIFNIIIFVLVISLLYLIIKSIGWNLINNGKLGDYKRYLRRFFGFSFLMILILIPLFYLMLIKSRPFLLGYLFEGSFIGGVLLQILLLGIVFVLVVYLGFSGYVYSNKLRILETIKRIFSFKRFWLFLVLLIVFFVSGLIIRYGLIISTSVYNMGFLAVLISFIFTWYKFYISERLR